MLQLFRNNSPYTVILLFLFALLIKLHALLHPVLPVALPHQALYGLVLKIFGSVLGKSAFGYAFVALLILFGEAIYLNTIIIRHRLFAKSTYLPAFVFLALSSLIPALSNFTPFLLVNACLLPALDLALQFGQTTQPRKLVFNAGFFLALASLLHFPALAYFAFFIFALLMLRPFNIGETVVALLGYLTPFYFFAGVLFLADRLPLLRRWPELGFSLPKKLVLTAPLVVLASGIVVLLAGGLLVLQGQMQKSTIYVRRSWSVVMALLVASLPAAVLSAHNAGAAWLMAVPALSMIVAAMLYLEKRKRLSTFAFFFILAFTIICQFTLDT